jgi:hypothetical protein
VTSRTPVFAIHGVNNRSDDELTERVKWLVDVTDGHWPIYPVYWGDLGAETEHVRLALPERPRPRGPLRGGAPVGNDARLVAELLSDRAADGEIDDSVRLAAVQAGAERRLGPPGGSGTRAPDPAMAGIVQDAIADAWPGTRWLRLSGNVELLGEVGAAVAASALDVDAAAEGSVPLRDPGRIRALVGRRMAELDRIVGSAVGAAGQHVSTWVRGPLAEGIAGVLGDMLVYQRAQHRIHDRVRAAIAAVDPLLGRDPGHRVHLIGHSFGATIALDMATAHSPLWTAGLVTFGAQWPLFHLIDPRGGHLQPYRDGQPVLLPDSVGRWSNLWEPLDPMAFVATRAFAADPADRLEDVRVEHQNSSGLGTHSVYWQHPRLLEAMVDTFGGSPISPEIRDPGWASDHDPQDPHNCL